MFAVKGISKYGNVELDVSSEAFVRSGIECGDIVTVTLPTGRFDMPVGSNYSDVDSGRMLLQVNLEHGRRHENAVLAINMGSMAERTGLAVKAEDESGAFCGWRYAPTVTEPVAVDVVLNKKNGYLGDYLIHRLEKTDRRTDYPRLSDAEFANFRPVCTTGMGRGALYRSSSPIDPAIGRSVYADAALEAAGVRTILNLTDDEASMRACEGFAGSRYAEKNVICLNMGVDWTSASFREGFARGVRFMLAQDGPYMSHCREGRDRTGFFSAVLECLMGASGEDVVRDYMETYRCFYGVDRGEKRYTVISRRNICQALSDAFGMDDVMKKGCGLSDGARRYLLGLGLAEAEIDELKARLEKNYQTDQ